MNRATIITQTLRFVLFMSLGFVSVGGHAFADTINVGFISFDGFVPGSSGSPGVNEFSINNFTGDPGLGGSALPVDFPIFTFLTIQGAQLTLVESSGHEVFALGDLAPGTTVSDLITASTDILSATLSGTISQTALALSDGSAFTAESASIQATVLPLSPPFLGTTDFALITVSNSATAVPEPATWCLLLVGALPFTFRLTKKSR